MLNASLDTSFWNIASQIGVIPYLFSYFKIYYCPAVEQEIITTDPHETPLIYPQAMLFLVLKEDKRLHLVEPQQPLNIYGLGESHAIALAREQKWLLLINDARPLAFAQSLGISCVSVPDFTVLLYAQGKITSSAINGYLSRLATTTSHSLIQQAQEVVDKITLAKGEK